MDDDYARLSEVVERSPLPTYVHLAPEQGASFELDERGIVVSHLLREHLPVSPEGVKLELVETPQEMREAGASLTVKIELTVPLTEYEELIVELENHFGDRARCQASGVFANAFVRGVQPVRSSRNRDSAERAIEDPGRPPNELSPVEIKLSDAGSWVFSGPPIARGNMLADAAAHRLQARTLVGSDGVAYVSAEVYDGTQQYFFAKDAPPELQARLRYATDLQGPTGRVETPLEDLNGIVPKLQWQSWPDAQTAIAHFEKRYGITKIMASGYNMFQAGTTLQAGLANNCRYAADHPDMYEKLEDSDLRKVNRWGPTDMNWVPKYMALASTSEASIDVLYQMLGRCFVDLGADARNRPIVLPPHPVTGAPWKVQLLGARALIPAVDLYAKLELRFSQLEGMTLTAAIAHLAQFAKSHHPNPTRTLDDPDVSADRKQHVGGALPLMLLYRLGVEGRLNGFHEFFRLMEKPTRYDRDEELLTPIPPRDPDLATLGKKGRQGTPSMTVS